MRVGDNGSICAVMGGNHDMHNISYYFSVAYNQTTKGKVSNTFRARVRERTYRKRDVG